MALFVECSAFCTTCPPPASVTGYLAQLGLALTYMRPAEAAQDSLPPLPAQYHYEGQKGLQVLFLAGPDAVCLADDEDEDGNELPERPRRYPPHASRFWLIPGADPLATRCVQDALAERWAFHWCNPLNKAFAEHAA